MSKILKILTFLVASLLIALSVFISTFDVNKYKEEIITIVETKTGRDFDISGDLKLGVSLIPTVIIEDIKFGNFKRGSRPDMIKAKSFEVQFSLIPLFAGEVKFSQIVLDTADILLETNKRGKGNWEFQTEQEKNADDVLAVDISELNIKNSNLIYKDGVTGKESSVFIKKFIAGADVFSQALDVLLEVIYNDVAVDLEGSFGSLASLTNNRTFPVDFQAGVGDAQVKVKGKIAKPLNKKGIDLDIKFKASSLDPFAKILARELPDVGAIQLAGHVSESNETYKLDSVIAKFLDSQLSVDGLVSAKAPMEGFDLQINLETNTLANFNKIKDLTGKEFPDTGPLNLEGHISEQDGFYQLDTVKANLDKDYVLLNGTLSVQHPLNGFDMEIKFNTENLSKYNFLSSHSLPDAGPLQVSGHISEKDGSYLFKSVRAVLPESNLTVDGILTNIKETEGSNLKIDFQTTSLAELNEFTAIELPSLGPVTLIADISDRNGSYHLQNMTFKADKTDLIGNMSFNIKGDRPAVDATLESDLIDLTPFTTKYEKEEKEKEKQDKVFSSEPLPLANLKAVDAILDIKAKQIKTADHTLDNVVLDLKLNNGNLVLSKLNTSIGGGSLAMYMTLDASSGKIDALDTNFDLKNFQLSTLPDLKDKISGARTDLTIKVKGSGGSVAEVMAGLNGNVLLTIGEGDIMSEQLGISDAEILTTTLNFLDPQPTPGNSRKLICGVVNFDIIDGIAKTDKGIALSMQRIDIIGSGIIDLKTEKLNIAVKPRTKGVLGISAGNLAELVKIAGTLAEPNIAPDTVAALKKAVSVGAAFATGGISLLVQGLLGKVTADSDPCATARGIQKTETALKETTTQTE